MPATKLGRLVLEKKIKTIEEIYLYSLPVKGKSFCCVFISKHCTCV